VLDKRAFYSLPEVSESYDEQRFGSPSGARVNAREIGIVLGMVPTDGRVLDLACGTGRVSRALAERGQPVIAVDYSPPMAVMTAGRGIPTAIADAFATPFMSSTFDAVVSLRFAFHQPHLEPLLAEMRRLIAPGGCLVFDTYSWSPRAAMALGSGRWGGRVWVHSPQEVRRAANDLRLCVDAVSPCFLFSPYLYRLAPLTLERVFESLEGHLPSAWRCRVFWKLSAT
jgi:SAM-dependent methyltransferase